MKKLLVLFLLLTLVHFLQAQRNVILIIADDLGTDYLGFYEDHQDTAAMPNIRKLLSKGVRFTNAMSNPVCSATRAGMLTGRYSFRTGVGGIVGGMGGSGVLDINEITIPRLLDIYQPNKIGKANIGKWHLHQPMPVSNLNNPNIMGYDYFAGNFIGQLTSYTNWTKVTNGVSSTVTTYATTETANDAINWINTQNPNPQTKKPFFLWLAFNAPHAPYHLPPAGLHSYTNLSGTPQDIMANPKSYFKASLEALDHEIGRVFDNLQAKNLLDSTDIIFIGDNGNTMQTAQIANTDRAKGTIYQYGIHVPFIISGPSVTAPGRVSDALVNTTDLFATILELFGYNDWKTQIPANKPVDSKSILPILKNTGSEVRPWAFTEIFKVTTDGDDGKTMRNHDFKLLHFNDGHEEFYQLANDPGETNNLMLAPLNATQTTNYLYLCNEMSTLVGTGSFCNPAIFPPLLASLTTTNVDCFGNAVGAINLNVSGGKLPYSFNWGDGVAAQNRSGLAAGTYTVTITDAAAQTLVQTATITQPNAALSVADSAVNVTCFGAMSGSIHLLANGGTPAYTYTWNDGNTEQNRTNLPAGTYSVTVTDANQCTVSVSKNISQPEAISTVIFATDATCGEQNGSIHTDISGGTAPYTIIWSDNSTWPDLVNIPSRDYGFTITDANGCTYTNQVIINNIDGPSTSVSATSVNCYGGADGAINLNVIGDAAPFTYQWSDGASTPNRSGLMAGQYIVTIMDANGCSSIVSEIIAQPSDINAYTDIAPDACEQANGAIILSVIGGSQPYSFNWSNGETSKFLIGISAGIYTVTVTDAHGCTKEITRTVEATQAPTITVAKTNVKCFGDASGAIALTIGDGAQPYEFHWSNGSTDDHLAAIPTGDYALTLTDANGCTRSISESISQPESPLTTSAESVNATCFGTATGSINLLPIGGTAPYSFSWNNGANAQQLSNLSAADYRATVTDFNGCSTEISQLITEPTSLMVIATSTPAISSDGTVTATANGGTAPYHFKWNTGQEDAHVNNLTPGVYTVTITDANDCSATASTVVEMIVSTNNLLVANDLKIQTHPNPAQDRIFVTSKDPGMQAYYVRITDALGKTVYMLPRPQLANGIDVKDFQPGIYFLQLMEETTQKVFTIQFSKI